MTVWATEQENMGKVAKWEHAQVIDAGPSTAGQPLDTRESAGAACSAGTSGTADYFVPWHLPLHRAEAASVAARRGQQAASAGGGQGEGGPRIDRTKGTVMFRRYYHLFEAGELEGLVEKLEGVVLHDSFFDKDNWCCVFERG